ncbi:hypothetical protein BS78_06G053500 [Paspalum vaginatum]|nr:hypothetical protein BS78_06G053500 [Paspalum vaginatum]
MPTAPPQPPPPGAHLSGLRQLRFAGRNTSSETRGARSRSPAGNARRRRARSAQITARAHMRKMGRCIMAIARTLFTLLWVTTKPRGMASLKFFSYAFVGHGSVLALYFNLVCVSGLNYFASATISELVCNNFISVLRSISRLFVRKLCNS